MRFSRAPRVTHSANTKEGEWYRRYEYLYFYRKGCKKDRHISDKLKEPGPLAPRLNDDVFSQYNLVITRRFHKDHGVKRIYQLMKLAYRENPFHASR